MRVSWLYSFRLRPCFSIETSGVSAPFESHIKRSLQFFRVNLASTLYSHFFPSFSYNIRNKLRSERRHCGWWIGVLYTVVYPVAEVYRLSLRMIFAFFRSILDHCAPALGTLSSFNFKQLLWSGHDWLIMLLLGNRRDLKACGDSHRNITVLRVVSFRGFGT